MGRLLSTLIIFLSTGALHAADTVHITPDMDAQAVIEADTTPGKIFYLHAGEYRGVAHVKLKTGQQVIGELGPNGERLAVFNGSRKLTNWKKEGDYWVHEGVGNVSIDHGICWNTFQKACANPENLYMDDMFLREVDTLSDLGKVEFDRMVYPHIGPYEQQAINQDIKHGTWFFDMEAGKVYMLDDPTGHKMEISAHKRVFDGGGDSLVYKNFIIEKYANQLQSGAMGVSSAYTLIDNVESRLNHAIGMAVYHSAPGIVIRNSYVHHNGQLGIKLQGVNGAIVEDCEVSYNDLHRTIAAWFGEEGGIKVVSNAVDPVLRNNWVHHNWGKGLWFDGWTKNGIIEGNLCEKNAEMGIFLEIMDTLNDSAHVRYNISRRNGYCLWFYGTQIQTSASQNCYIHHNVVLVDDMHDANAVTAIWQVDDSYRGSLNVGGNYFHHNDITWNGIGVCEDRTEMGASGKYSKYGLAISTWGKSLDTPEKKEAAFNKQREFVKNPGIVFDYNAFHVPEGYDRPSWHWPPAEPDADGDGETDGKLMNWYSFEEFQQKSGQDKNSTLDNDVDSTGVRALVKLQNMGAPRKTIETLAGYLNLDPDNLSIRPQALVKKVNASIADIRFAGGHISLNIPAGDSYRIGIYDQRGRAIVEQAYTIGRYAPDRTVNLDARGIARGVYVIKVSGERAGTAIRNITALGQNSFMRGN